MEDQNKADSCPPGAEARAERSEIGGYKVVKLLGRGGMSEVLEVERPLTGSHHALKLFAYPKEDPQVLARFETEGRLLARLSHPRIVKVTDIGTDEASGKPYFVMDLVLDPDGAVKTLGDVPDGEADEDTIGKWYDDIREGLSYIHSCGVVHRDLKLQNVMIGPDGHAVITDFGVSKIFNPKGQDVTVVDPVQTIIRMREGKGLVMGSLGYMAPEIEMGMPASPKSDWFALGVIVYKLLTGMWCDAKTDVSGTLDTYDPVWKRVIPKLLHSNPEGRECLSYAEEKTKNREAYEAALEKRWLAEKARGHFARHFARYTVAAAVVLLAILFWQVRESRIQREAMRQKLEAEALRLSASSFDDLFKVPAEAKADGQIDDNGDTVMFSRAQFEAARVDALVLTQPILSALASGRITIEKAIDDFKRFRDGFGEDSMLSPLDSLHFGDTDWTQFGESGPLQMLFDRAIDRLKAVAED